MPGGGDDGRPAIDQVQGPLVEPAQQPETGDFTGFRGEFAEQRFRGGKQLRADRRTGRSQVQRLAFGIERRRRRGGITGAGPQHETRRHDVGHDPPALVSEGVTPLPSAGRGDDFQYFLSTVGKL